MIISDDDYTYKFTEGVTDGHSLQFTSSYTARSYNVAAFKWTIVQT